jgi:ATP-dependent helicase/DNAse subunit B
MPSRPALDCFRQALREGRTDLRLLVPTATMAEHLQHRLAREGFVFQRSLIQTLSAFVKRLTPELREVPETVLYLIVEQAARRVARAEFAAVAHMPGFCASVARVVSEFSSAGCDSARLARCLPEAPLGEAFLAVYRETDRELAARGLVLRAARLEAAARRIETDGLPGIREIWLDGFHALPDPELRLIAALRKHAEVTVTEPATGTSPAVAIVRAPSVERECDEIARRILDQAASGRPFREIGIVVRAADAYVPLLRSTLERYGIPARFYFDSPLERHPAVRYLAGAVDAMLGGWDHQTTLAVLRLAPRFADLNALDALDFATREQTPNSGLGILQGLTQSDLLHHRLDALAALEEWQAFVLTPRDWAARLRTLRNLYRPSIQESPDHDLALLYRSQAAALDTLDEAFDEAAEALDPAPTIGLTDYWSTIKSVLRMKPLRLDDGRRNVVHVLSAPEARQWALPVVFVCGLVEKQFPQFHRQDPFFPDAARARLNAAGVRVRTAAQFEQDERALFDTAVSRATILATLTYPEFDARGDRNLPSLYLDSFAGVAPDEALCCRPAAGSHAGHGPALQNIQAPALLDYIRTRTAKVSPTALEAFLQCPFQYFGTRFLRLRTAPPLPAERLDFLTQGNIVHEVLKRWWQDGGDIAATFETVFSGAAEENNIPAQSYQTERKRNAMLADLRAFAADERWPRGGATSRTEEDFEIELAPELIIRGKIDRLDTMPTGEAYVLDYKYSNGQNTKNRREDESLLQAPLYLMAAERQFHVRPAGFFYLGVKAEILYVGWSDSGLLDSIPIPQDWLERTKTRTLEIVGQIRAGTVAPKPADRDKCRWCDARDICRIESGQAEAPAPLAEGA